MYRRIQSRMWCVGNGFHGREATSSPYAPEFRLYGEASDVVETGSDGTSRTSLNETAKVGDRDVCLDATGTVSVLMTRRASQAGKAR
jgi:hypothetical protein